MLDEIRKQEQILNQSNEDSEEAEEAESNYEPGVVAGDSGQTTLFGGEN